MARRKMVAGNWKLHNTIAESLTLVDELKHKLTQVRDCDIVVAPVYTALHSVAKRLENSSIAVAGQDVFYEDKGAYTGAVSAPLLQDAGCTYCLVGHSERRQHFGETLETSAKRVAAVLAAGMQPIVCVGETLQEREADRTQAVVQAQLDAALQGTNDTNRSRVIVAYEPVWAIGTGQTATPMQAQEVHASIRELLRSRDIGWGDATRILYGGSVKPDNASHLFEQPDVDGGLVGGASLKADDFCAIVQAARR